MTNPDGFRFFGPFFVQDYEGCIVGGQRHEVGKAFECWVRMQRTSSPEDLQSGCLASESDLPYRGGRQAKFADIEG